MVIVFNNFRKLQFQDFPILKRSSNSIDVEDKTKFKPVLRRVSVLNKLFMRYITDLIVNGEYWTKYTSLGIEITMVY